MHLLLSAGPDTGKKRFVTYNPGHAVLWAALMKILIFWEIRSF